MVPRALKVMHKLPSCGGQHAGHNRQSMMCTATMAMLLRMKGLEPAKFRQTSRLWGRWVVSWLAIVYKQKDILRCSIGMLVSRLLFPRHVSCTFLTLTNLETGARNVRRCSVLLRLLRLGLIDRLFCHFDVFKGC